MNKMRIEKFFKKKKILITGHTGFKGSWLSQWMIENQGNVFGSLKIYLQIHLITII